VSPAVGGDATVQAVLTTHETRLDSVQSGSPRIVGALATNLGATQTITFTGAEEVWLLGTLNANLTVTLASRTAGARLKLIAVQDGTGSRTLAISDGTTPTSVTIPTAAGAGVVVDAGCPNSTDITIVVPGGGGSGDTHPFPISYTTGLQTALDAKALASDLTAHLNDTSDAHDASAVSYAGGTGMSATDVEAAIDELATEKISFGADEAVNTIAATGATETVPAPTTATVNVFTLDANCTLTFPTAAAGRSFTLVLKQDATGSRTVTWPGTVQWPAGAAPTLTTTANKRDVLTFLCGLRRAGHVHRR
jgi:hypothetical protein